MAAKANANYLRIDWLPKFIKEDNLENETVGDLAQRTEAYQGRLGGASWICLRQSCYLVLWGDLPIMQNTARLDLADSSKFYRPNRKAMTGSAHPQPEHQKMVPDINHTVTTAGYGPGGTVTIATRAKYGGWLIY